MDLIIKLIDKIIKLAEVRSLKRRQLFNDHIEPVYSDIRQILKYYRESIFSINQLINNCEFSPELVVSKLRELRQTNIDERRELHSYLDSLARDNISRKDEINAFILSCIRFIFCEPFSSDVVNIITRRSRLKSLEEDLALHLEKQANITNTKELFILAVDKLSNQLDDSWAELSKNFYGLKVAYLK